MMRYREFLVFSDISCLNLPSAYHFPHLNSISGRYRSSIANHANKLGVPSRQIFEKMISLIMALIRFTSHQFLRHKLRKFTYRLHFCPAVYSSCETVFAPYMIKREISTFTSGRLLRKRYRRFRRQFLDFSPILKTLAMPTSRSARISTMPDTVAAKSRYFCIVRKTETFDIHRRQTFGWTLTPMLTVIRRKLFVKF